MNLSDPPPPPPLQKNKILQLVWIIVAISSYSFAFLCITQIQITKAERDVYAATIDQKVAVKIGPGHYEPPSGPQKWSLALEGRDYKVWETS